MNAVIARAGPADTNAAMAANGYAIAQAFAHCHKKSDGSPKLIAVMTPDIINDMKNAITAGNTKRALPCMVHLILEKSYIPNGRPSGKPMGA